MASLYWDAPWWLGLLLIKLGIFCLPLFCSCPSDANTWVHSLLRVISCYRPVAGNRRHICVMFVAAMCVTKSFGEWGGDEIYFSMKLPVGYWMHKHIMMAQCKNTVSSVLIQWRYCSVSLIHQIHVYVLYCEIFKWHYYGDLLIFDMCG